VDSYPWTYRGTLEQNGLPGWELKVTTSAGIDKIIVDYQSPGALQFSKATYTATENAGTVTITVTRTNGNYGAVSVSCATANGTAIAGQDYTSTSGTLNWSAGDAASKSFTVTLLDDSADESDETFSVNLTGASGASLNSPVSATVTVIDDDTLPVLLVTPSMNDFDQVAVGSTNARSFTVENSGGGTLSGSAVVSSPFSVFSGGSYSLGAGQSAQVVVRYTPGAAGSHSNNVSFSGESGAQRPVIGQAFSATADSDADGMSDWAEVIAGTSPSNARSCFVLCLTATADRPAGSNSPILQWPSASNRIYQIYRSTNLAAGFDQPIISNLPAAPPVNVYTDTAANVAVPIFYTVHAERP
jgi:hypothetical protein